MTSISPLNQNYPIVDPKTGYYTSYFKRFMDLLLGRVGGISGGSYSQLTNSSGSIFWDLNASPIAFVELTNGTNTMSPPVNLVAGLLYPYRLTMIQPASGSAGTISWPTNFYWPASTAPTLSTGNNDVDMLVFVSDGTNMYAIVGENAYGN